MKRTGVDWLTWVADRSREHEAFRHDLDRWGIPDQQAAQTQALRELVPRLLDAYPPETYLDAREQERTAVRHVTTHGVFGPPTDVVCVTNFPPRIDAAGETVDVVAAGKGITFAAKAEPAVHRLLSGHPVNLAQLTEETGVNAAALADTLIQEGLCAEVTAELAAGFAGWVDAG